MSGFKPVDVIGDVLPSSTSLDEQSTSTGGTLTIPADSSTILIDDIFKRKDSNPWVGIDSAPKGVEFLAKTKNGFIFITEYRPDDVEGSGAYGIIHNCCGNYEDMNPYKWKRLE